MATAIHDSTLVPVPIFTRWPQNDAELWAFVAAVWGVEIPRVRICASHKSPFEAFADSFFARSPVSVWKASRGFGGKSYLLATLGVTEQLVFGADVTILGGSGAQSARVHEYMRTRWAARFAPRHLLIAEPTLYETRLSNGGRIRALMASQTSVRGPHPQRLRLDEVDEIDLAVLDAALGQPMATEAIAAQTVLSSTQHNPDGTMTAVLRRAGQNAWPVYEWCYRETMQPHGWLRKDEIARKQGEVPSGVWATEFDLQEPSPESRAIDPSKVTAMFAPALGTHSGIGYAEFEPPLPAPMSYVHGADWAKEQDWTVVVTLRTDCRPVRLVAFERVQRKPWPQMVEVLDRRLKRYGGIAAHDATGLGNVVSDLLTSPAVGTVLVGRARSDMFSGYIKAIESDDVRVPVIEPMLTEHKYATNDDIYGSGHPPDSFVAMALAYQFCGPISTGQHKAELIGTRVTAEIPF